MSSLLVVVVNVGLAAVVYLLLVRRIDRRLEPGRVVDNIRSEIEGIIVELNQTTDRNIGLIEDRVSRLNNVLEQADRRLSLLKRELESRASSSERYNDILKRAPRSAHAPSGARDTEHSETSSGSGPAGDTAAAPDTGPAAGSGDTREARKKEIIDLHRKGIAANIIANRTGTTVGEVELVISLNDRTQ
jgi:hypothetical protein